jgi:hypothetical protein
MWPFKKKYVADINQYNSGHIYGTACIDCGAPTDHLDGEFRCYNCENDLKHMTEVFLDLEGENFDEDWC